MHEHQSKPQMRVRASLAAALIAVGLALPAAAAAQDPSADQYATSTPSGGGNVPASPNSAGGSPTVSPDGSSSGPASDGATPSAGAPLPGSDAPSPSPSPSAGNDAGVTAAGAEGLNKAQRTVANLGADSRNAQETVAANASADPATQLLRSDSGSGSGTGPLLWIVLGGTLIWALASGVGTYRRRPPSGPSNSATTSASRTQEGQTA